MEFRLDKPPFINVFQFVKDTSKPGRTLSWCRIGDMYMSRLVIEPGVTTGNYYHKDTRVTFYVGSGQVEAAFVQVVTGQSTRLHITAAKQVVQIPSYVAHSTKNVGTEPAVLVFFSNRKLRSGDDYEFSVLD